MEQTTKSSTPEKTEGAAADAGKENLSPTQAAVHRLFYFIIQDDGMMNMTKQEIFGILNYTRIAISELFTPATLREVIEAGGNRTSATSNHQNG